MTNPPLTESLEVKAPPETSPLIQIVILSFFFPGDAGTPPISSTLILLLPVKSPSDPARHRTKLLVLPALLWSFCLCLTAPPLHQSSIRAPGAERPHSTASDKLHFRSMRSTDIKAVKYTHVARQNVRVKLRKYVFPPERQLGFIVPPSRGFPS